MNLASTLSTTSYISATRPLARCVKKKTKSLYNRL